MTATTAVKLRRALFPALAVAALTLSACGTSEDTDDADGGGDDTAQNDDAQNDDADGDAPEDAGPVTVTDARGEEITLDEPAQDVVALEWSEAEDLVILGVMPVGVADVEGYGTWVQSAPLDDSVTDVGTRQEPSVDSIVGLDPDLVITEDRGNNLIAQLEEYVPVMVIEGADASDNIGQMKENFTTIATAVGKDDEAEQILADFDATLADGRQQLEDAGVAGEQFAMADGWMEGSSVAIRMFGQGSLVSDLAEELGLVNAWDGEVDEAWGLGQTDVEGLTGLGDVHFFYSSSDEENVFAEGLADNAIWNDLPFVQSDQVYKLDDGTWTFGGPASSTHIVDQFVEILGG
ncbi:ABC transporter substrate-binding protein [Phytoactinopolyspora halotolerans]|uniref:Iron-siderophore ABC transporter substrate-binding protein n=1 Tax=Phytoactinopolyspora halotolerans TaxID=1981512 RepID=A0A6L9S433_9ACTN|nr:iron-siderophore ABC transporter substrate-binding protein [Phytoactinopolyspora halotolerans]NED99885.1 iron-siderophore ABC transporter substrate-binding protein [Phytoactinopolyspora halotolerans]